MHRSVATVVGIAMLALASPAAAQDETLVRVGITLPLSGSGLASSGPIRDAVELALAEAAIPGVRLEAVVLDHAVNGLHNPQQGARDMTAFIADPAVLAVVGPFNSTVAQAQIPLSNEAGLLQCSPANTAPGLTKGEDGRRLRAAAPDRINYIRVQATDDVQGPAMAGYGMGTLGLSRVAIVDDTETYGKGIADQFEGAWLALGGEVVGHQGVAAGASDYLAILTGFAALQPDSLYFGGVTSTGAPLLRRQMVQAGLGGIPFLVAEGVSDGSGEVADSYIALTGEAAAGTWTSQSALHDYPGREALAASVEAAYGTEPAAYTASAYACAQVILRAIGDAAAAGTLTRDAVRAAGTDPDATFDTVIGPIGFDAVGDIEQQVVSFYRTDLAIDPDPAVPGSGDWVFVEQVEASSGD